MAHVIFEVGKNAWIYYQESITVGGVYSPSMLRVPTSNEICVWVV